MHTVIKQKKNTFRKIPNPNITGSYCGNLNCGRYIDYKEDCMYNHDLKLILCLKCKPVSQNKQNKYRNTPRLYDGHVYQSTKEAKYAIQLDLRKRAGEIKGWEKQVKIDLKVLGQHICNYYCDFIITHNDGTKEYIDVKSDATVLPLFMIKWRLLEIHVKNFEPENKLTIVK